MHAFSVSGQFIDLKNDRIYPATVAVSDGKIQSVTPVDVAPDKHILPGFVDAHIHIESSMLVPTSFAPLAVVQGTVATVSDPHEIANVCGLPGVRYMIESAKRTPFKFFFGAPSCVPATNFETAGATLDANDVAVLMADPDIWYLSEMMNYPGVLFNDPSVMAKIAAAHRSGKPVDGHAPGLRGEQAASYAAAGITTDHECYTLDEAVEKVALGMHILIREGSAARNYDALCDLLRLHPGKTMFCSDDKHPDELAVGHINDLVARSVQRGYNLFDVLRAACVNPVQHYKLPVGQLQTGDPADFIVVQDLKNFKVAQTFVSGKLVAENGKSMIEFQPVPEINQFRAKARTAADFRCTANSANPTIRVIEAMEGQLITNELHLPARVSDGQLVSDVANDVLKMAVINRYEENAPVAVAFIKNIGLKRGAIASTVGHDCHNLIVVGADDESMTTAVNALIACKGGISVASGDGSVDCLPLPIAGLMSDQDGYTTGKAYSELNAKARALGTPLHAPFMTLSFMALLVIPALKLSDKGLFDGGNFAFTPLEV